MDSQYVRADVRARLIAQRADFPGRDLAEARLRARVASWLAALPPCCVAFYWPYRGEPDLRGELGHWLAAGGERSAALPVIRDGVMGFLAWTPESPMTAGAYGIAVPAQGDWVVPDAILIPCVGFDAAGYRLGYGAGWYDRTLAQLVPRPRTAGIAFERGRLESIEPEAHDIPLDTVLTDAG